MAALRALGSKQAVIGMFLVALLASVIVLVAMQKQRWGADYYQQRDLRTLETVGKNVTNYAVGLRTAAAIHFNPYAMDFSLSPDSRCLLGTIHVPVGSKGEMRIDYAFVDPERTRRWLAHLLEEDDAALSSARAGVAPGADVGRMAVPPARLPAADRCTLSRPPGAPAAAAIDLADGLTVNDYLPLDELVRRSVRPGPPPPHTVVEEALKDQAGRQLVKRDPADTIGSTDTIADIVAGSIRSAFLANLIHVEATLAGETIGGPFVPAPFNAVRLSRPAAAGSSTQPTLLWQQGEVPPLLEHGQLDEADQVLLGLIGSRPAAAADKPAAPQANAALSSASVSRIGNLLIYQRDYVGPAGLDCTPVSPCKLTGVREARALDHSVNQLNGTQATWLLIGVLTVIALIPLVQLALNRRLDPLRLGSQYLLWLSLMMLTASATIATLTILATSAIGKEAEAAAKADAAVFKGRFARELTSSIPHLAATSRSLDCTLPRDTSRRFPTPLTLDPERNGTQRSGFISETVMLFDGKTGTMSPDRLRWNRLIAPSYAASIADRDYFHAVRQRKFLVEQRKPFRIDQVFSKPDGLRKTVIAFPADCRPVAKGPPGHIAIATGYLRTFLMIRPRAGLRYAVVDASVASGPDVLFHTDRRRELVDRFVDDVDDSAPVTAALQEPESAHSISTLYDGLPARLWFFKLYEGLDWTLVLIEDNNQASFGVWRSAVTGYVAWFLALILGTAGATVLLARHPGAFDRMPFIWLWPPDVLTDYTLQFTEDKAARDTIKSARLPYAVRAWASLAFLPTVAIAPGASRILLAMATVALTFSARAAYQGLLDRQLNVRQPGDRFVAVVGMGIAAVAALAALAAAFAANGQPWPLVTGIWTMFVALLAAALFAVGPGCRLAPQWRHVLLVPVARPVKWVLCQAPAWGIALAVGAAAPALAGFLDASDANAGWSRQVEQESGCRFEKALDDRIEEINRTLLDDGRLTQRAPFRCRPAAAAGLGWVGRGVSWLGLNEMAKTFSRAIPMRWHWPTPNAGLAALVPLLALGLALRLFHREFFPKPPPRMICTDTLTSDNLVPAIKQIAKDAHEAKAAGLSPPTAVAFPFSSCKRHLIVGRDLFQSDDSGFRRSADIWMYDLLTETKEINQPEKYGAVVIHNFDVAVFHPQTSKTALAALTALIAQQDKDAGHLHLFLFAASEPLDRIVNISRQGRTAQDSKEAPKDPEPALDDYRWAQLLQPFALYNIGQPPLQPRPPLLQQELAIARTGSVELLEKGYVTPPGEEDEGRLVAFLTDFLAEHYRLLWETSTRDEQVILFEIALGSHLKMIDCFALRSLLLRGLLVRGPEYRIMNRSFARYVRSVGTADELREAAKTVAGGTDTIWPALRIPLGLLVVAGLLLLILLTPNDSGAAAILPALAAAVPALVGSWLRLRPSASS